MDNGYFYLSLLPIGYYLFWDIGNKTQVGYHLHLSSCLLPADTWTSHICPMSIRLPSSLANSDKLIWVWPSTLQTVNLWCHNEYSCCSHSSSYSFPTPLLSRSDQWSDCQTWCGKMVGYRPVIFQLVLWKRCFFQVVVLQELLWNVRKCTSFH